MCERSISLNQIVKELHEEGYEVYSERQYRRYFETFFSISGSSIERFKKGNKYLFSNKEALIYKELIRLMDLDGFMSKWLSGKKEEITEFDIVNYYELIEKALNTHVENNKLEKQSVDDFLYGLDMSINYTFTKLIYELDEKFTALMKITNIYPYNQQLKLLKDMISRFDPFFDSIYVQAMRDIIDFTKEKMENHNMGNSTNYIQSDGTITYTNLPFVDRDKRVREFFDAYPEEKLKIEKYLGKQNIEELYISND